MLGKVHVDKINHKISFGEFHPLSRAAEVLLKLKRDIRLPRKFCNVFLVYIWCTDKEMLPSYLS